MIKYSNRCKDCGHQGQVQLKVKNDQTDLNPYKEAHFLSQ
jgi:hypothetical protein